MSQAAALGLSPDDLVELVQVNLVGTPVESVMRIRALMELSTHSDAATLMALAAAAATPGMTVDDLMATLGPRRR